MSYIELINVFERWLESNYLPAQSQLLFYKLLVIFNRSAWAEWVSVDNLRLMALAQIPTESTLIRHRDNLMRAGLIFYQKGKKGSPNKYKINTSILQVQSLVYPLVETQVQSLVYPLVQTTDINRLRLRERTKEISPDGDIKKNSTPYEEIRERYNQICVDYPSCTKLSQARKRAIQARFAAGYRLSDFETLFQKAEESAFLKGKNNRNWKATFDWLLKDQNMAKVLDGNYDNKADAGKQGEKEHSFDLEEFERTHRNHVPEIGK